VSPTRIVAASRGVGEDAGIGERLMASARSLVQVRPVGEVEGEEPGAIAARMEVALSEGNLDRARRMGQAARGGEICRRRLSRRI
jgi:hypothetical protein